MSIKINNKFLIPSLVGVGSAVVTAAIAIPVTMHASYHDGHIVTEQEKTIIQKMDAHHGVDVITPEGYNTDLWASSIAYASKHHAGLYGEDFVKTYRDRFQMIVPSNDDPDLQDMRAKAISFDIIPNHDINKLKLEIEYRYEKTIPESDTMSEHVIFSSIKKKQLSLVGPNSDLKLDASQATSLTTKVAGNFLNEAYWAEGMARYGILYSNAYNPYIMFRHILNRKGMPVHVDDIDPFRKELLEGSRLSTLPQDVKDANYETIIDLTHLDNRQEFSAFYMHLIWDLAYKAVLENKSSYKIGYIYEDDKGTIHHKGFNAQYNPNTAYLIRDGEDYVKGFDEMNAKVQEVIDKKNEKAKSMGSFNINLEESKKYDASAVTPAQASGAVSISQTIVDPKYTIKVSKLYKDDPASGHFDPHEHERLAKSQGIVIADADITFGDLAKPEKFIGALWGFKEA